jgi:myo-inositol-1(or 4)-monophosphatase
MSPGPSFQEDLDLLRDAAREAGGLALSRRRKGLKIRSKPGGSPVTDADLAVDALLTDRLRKARPGYGWLSEETGDDPARLAAERIFVVDPIDGTTAFMKNRPWFSVALAVVEHGRPVVGVVFAPALDEVYEAAEGSGARLNGAPIHPSAARSLRDCAMLGDPAGFPEAAWPPMRVERRNSIAYRMALVAAGAFDAAYAPTPKWDWDIAAGAAIATEAGACVTDHTGAEYRFNQADPRQPGLLCAAAGIHGQLVARHGGVKAP